MNILKGTISAIKVSGNLSLITINVKDLKLTTVIIETPNTVSYLKEGNPINVIFKETEVVIGKGSTITISLQNKIEGTIVEIEKGELLSKLTIETNVGKIVSVITTNAVNKLQLNIDVKVTAMIKTNEIMLSE